MKVLRASLFLCVLAASAPLRAQQQGFELVCTDGRTLRAERIDGGVAGVWTLTSGSASERIDARSVLCVAGPRALDSSLPLACFAGGDRIRGLVTGGNEGGDRLEIQSPTLGRLDLAVDRLERLVLRPAAAQPEDLVLPEGASEALFLPAALGFDRIAGALHQFSADGIRFQPESEKAPRWFAHKDLVGLCIAGSEAPTETAIAELVTRSGDRVALTSFTFEGASLRAQLATGASCTVAQGDVACLLRLDLGAVFASRTEPARVVESSPEGDATLPFRRDFAVSGSMLAAGGRCYARGLGVHSKSRLEFVVPPGVTSFVARVAFDDSALQLRVRGHVQLAARIGDAAPAFAAELEPKDGLRTVGPIRVQPGQTLSLEVEFGQGRDLGDRVDWLLCAFLP